ncbi:MAG: transcription-repair coupling factor [Verrucomicrobiae bacterium]|nr:transcription-repair coupling factor [Verrucomicrobiae bacterium]
MSAAEAKGGWAAFENTPAAQALLAALEQGGVLSLPRIAPAGVGLLAAWLASRFPRRLLVVVEEGSKAQEERLQDITTWLALAPTGGGPRPVLNYPAWESFPHEGRLPSIETLSERLAALVALQNSPAAGVPVVVTQVQALLQKTIAPEALRAHTRTLRRGDALHPLDLVEWLEDEGYEPEAKATLPGTLALRGGILDVYPPASPWPVRLEFFGDQIESLRFFDPATQISRETVEQVTLAPAGELGLLRQGRLAAAAWMEHWPADALVLLHDPPRLVAQAMAWRQQAPPDESLLLDWPAARERLAGGRRAVLEISDVLGVLTEPGGELTVQSLEAFRPAAPAEPDPAVADRQRREFLQQLHRWLRQGFAVWVLCHEESQCRRFKELWQELRLAEGPEGRPLEPRVDLAALQQGFLCPGARWVVATDAEIFGRYKAARPRRLKSPQAQAARAAWALDFSEMAPGDLVVHVRHGIGRYVGLERLTPARRPGEAAPPAGGQECLVIEYAPAREGQPPPKLYVPISEAHLVSRYVGAGKGRPKLSVLGSRRWAKTRAEAEAAAQALAAELLQVQALRATQPGHAFPPDGPWQMEFENAFPFEETPDQWKAIHETKKDLEQPRPMDRLICGDVGFGKTEVAIRAAFKVVMGGKQVALLAPTTVLAQQHYRTFTERMAAYPVKVEVLSRFRRRSEQADILRRLAGGGVDVVIGTHRLLQADVAFKDLGLVIIDEEQRFGVEHKEQLKRLRALVDVLTLSATPIPRTLHLALMGARDMSLIETPPPDRLPIETHVAEFDERLIQEAIQRELNRQGQVYYLHNRIEDLEAVAQRVKLLVPRARVVMGHGQMPARELERVMTQFVNGEADVLVSTTIIESGLDIPNANTIIIDRADRYGLSDLYQLRGRVGRYKHQAYAYLLIPRHAALLNDARKRISAIRQYSAPGSGFKVAMRDLEIRGAGNLLGTEQSGHINAVGFDLYCRLLRQSIARLKGEEIRAWPEAEVRLDFLALHPGEETPPPPAPPRRRAREPAVHIPREVAVYVPLDEVDESLESEDEGRIGREACYLPEAYIAEPALRLEAYRRLAATDSPEGLEQLKGEWRDRFGPLPEPVQRLLLLQEIKLLAARKGIEALETDGARLKIRRGGDFLQFGGKFPRLQKRSATGRLGEIRRFLRQLQDVSPPPAPAPGQ